MPPPPSRPPPAPAPPAHVSRAHSAHVVRASYVRRWRVRVCTAAGAAAARLAVCDKRLYTPSVQRVGEAPTALPLIEKPCGSLKREDGEAVGRRIEGHADARSLGGAAAAEEHRHHALRKRFLGQQLVWCLWLRLVPLIGAAWPRDVAGRAPWRCINHGLRLRYLDVVARYFDALLRTLH
eukprot:946545-Prymnesium_polylepis.1